MSTAPFVLKAMCWLSACGLPGAAQASFHFMQIEQVQAGVQGDAGQQAVQLRMRAAGQGQLQFSRLRASDANGANPVLLIDFATPVANAAVGDRILIASPGWSALQSPAPDFVLVAPLPPAYFAGGRLTFESDGGQIVYSLCWGTYAGPTAGSIDNDDDGQYGPCVPGALSPDGVQALRFGGSATTVSTTNAVDYALTPGAAVFTNNARVGAAVIAPPSATRGGDCDDGDPGVFPGNAEIAGNLRDDDCDGLADEDAFDVPSSSSDDVDGDGVSIQAGDCDDTDTQAKPGSPEVVGDRKDNDCDGRADEDAGDVYSADGIDHDGDGFAMFARVFTDAFE